MATTRESRIQPLVWYTLGEYKVYFVQLGEWYVKVFPRRGVPTKNPIFTFKGETKKKVVEQLDAHCMKTFGKRFRFKKAVHEAPVVAKKKTPTVHHVMPRSIPAVPDRDSINAYMEILHNLKIIKTLTTLGVMLSALAVTMIMLLNIMK